MTRTTDPKHKFLRKPCKKCERIFLPVSRYNYICPECIEEKERRRWGKSKLDKKKK